MSSIHIFLLCIFSINCLLLISSVLLQTGKGGGMAGLGGGVSDSAFGAHTANVLQKFTMYCVITFFVLVVVLAHTLKGDSGSESSVMDGYQAPVKEETALPVEPNVLQDQATASEKKAETPQPVENKATP